MALMSLEPLFPCLAVKFRDKQDGWPTAPTGQMVRESDGKVASVTSIPGEPGKCKVEWVDASEYSMKERFIYRVNTVDVWPDGFDQIGYTFGIKEP